MAVEVKDPDPKTLTMIHSHCGMALVKPGSL